jgi:hypothetical protein
MSAPVKPMAIWWKIKKIWGAQWARPHGIHQLMNFVYVSSKIAARMNFPVAMVIASQRSRCVMDLTAVGTVLMSAPALNHC